MFSDLCLFKKTQSRVADFEDDDDSKLACINNLTGMLA